MFKKLFLMLVLMCTCFIPVYAQESYEFYDGDVLIESFASISEARDFYQNNYEEYKEPILYADGEIADLKYGVVNFIFEEDTVSYESVYNGTSCLKKYKTPEGLFLGFEGNRVRFMLNGDIGYIEKNKTEIIPYHKAVKRISRYAAVNGSLVHYLNINFDNEIYEYSLSVDVKPDYFEDGVFYYSYDNHYFYDDFYDMADDYLLDSYEHAVNFENPYYNYYAYLSFRSYTNYSLEDLENYFYRHLGINSKITSYTDYSKDGACDALNMSQYYGELGSFLYYEKIYGTNALIMLGESMYESSSGKDFNSFENNSLFEHYAFDNEYERENERYENIESSVYSHSRYYLSRYFGSIHSSLYSGTYLGDRRSGMAVNCSVEPFYNEMVIANMYSVDSFLGLKDRNYYAQAITLNSEIDIYADETLESVMYSLKGVNSFIVLYENEDSYKIRLDNYTDENYAYDPEISCGYISKDDVTYVFNEIKEEKYNEIYLDYNGGILHYSDGNTLFVKDDAVLTYVSPLRDGYEFTGYEDNAAMYREIRDIEFVNYPDSHLYEGKSYDYSDSVIKLTYADGKSRRVNLDTSIAYIADNKLIVNYCGKTLEYELTYVEDNISENLSSMIDSNLNGEVNDNELDYIKQNLSKSNLQLDMETIRRLDALYLERSDFNYAFRDNWADISVSGFGLSFEEPFFPDVPRPFKDTRYVQMMRVNANSEDIGKRYGEAYGFELLDCFSLRYSLNLASAKPLYEQVVSYKTQGDGLYTVYCYVNRNIYKCYSEISDNYISFITRGDGIYFILRKDSINEYNYGDLYENISMLNCDPDIHMFMIEGFLVMTLIVAGTAEIIIYDIQKKREEKLWNDYRKSLQKPV